ncbi:MAG: DNA translocase FtsK 4TM domain-containing protein, partial [Actinomycetota bacterium]|nr:DNA translocase FtsK 4TM domain-containing protein [Actinomycetota bacterium]
MAIKTPPKSRGVKAPSKARAKAPAKKGSAARAAKAAARGHGARQTPARRRPNAAPVDRSRHAQDLVGLGLVAAGLLAALALFGDLAGPAGRELREAAGTSLGVGRFGLPVVIVAAGGLVLWRRPLPDPVRLGVCLLVLLAGTCGLLHLIRRGPAWGAPWEAHGEAGGAVGLVAAEPLRGLLGPWGAGLVLG